MAKSLKYSELLDILDFDLEQEKELPDTADADNFRNLPRTEAPRVINDVLKSLVKMNESSYTKEIIIHLYDSDVEHFPVRDGEYFYIDINECLSSSGKLLSIPKPIKEIKAYVQPNTSSDTDQRTGYWEIIDDSSISAAKIYAPSKDEIFNDDGWTAGDELRVKATLYPVDIKNSITPETVASATLESDGTVTVTLSSEMNIERGDVVTMSSCDPDDYDGTYIVIHKDGLDVYLDPVSAEPDGAFTTGDIGFDADDLIIDIDDGFRRLLVLEIKKMAYDRKQKSLSLGEYSELIREQRPMWVAEKGRVNTMATLNYGGASFGRKR